MDRSNSRRTLTHRAAIGVGLALLCLIVYANSLSNPLLFDDVVVIEQSERVTEGQFGRLLSAGYWERGHTDLLYRPLVSLSYGLNWAISRNPSTFRWVNLLLHIAVTILLFRFTLDLFQSRRAVLAAGAAAAIFAVHPIHSETINAIVGRADISATLFALAASWIWWLDGTPGRDSGWVRPVAAALCFAVALLCKESAITLPGVVLLLDWWRRAEFPSLPADFWSRRVWRAYLPIAAVVLGYLVLRYEVLGQLTGGAAVRRFENPIFTPSQMLGEGASPFLVRWGTPLVAFARAATLIFYPAGLSHDSSYPAFPEVSHLSDPRLWYGVGWVVLLGVACALSWLKRRELLVAVGLALVPYSVVSNFFIPIGTVFGERLLYMPSVGASIALGLLFEAGVLGAGQRWRFGRAAVTGFLLVLLVACSALTIRRNSDWKSPETLILSVGDGERSSYKVLDAFADRELRRGERLGESGDAEGARLAFDRAEAYAERAAEAVPESWGPLSRLGEVRMHRGQTEAAYETLRRAIEKGAGGDARTLRRAAQLAGLLGEYGEAALYLERYLEFQPQLSVTDKVNTRVAVAVALMLAGRPADALPQVQEAVRALPSDGRAQLTLVRNLNALGRTREAQDAARAALEQMAADDPLRAEFENRR